MPWAIATSGLALTARPALEMLRLPEDTPMVTRDLVRYAKPDPDLFLAAARLLGVDPRGAMVVGDSIWDLLAARRAGGLGIGVLSGGYGRDELERPAPTGCTRTRPSCSGTSTRSGSGGTADRVLHPAARAL